MRIDPTSCSADHTATMLATHSQIAAVRAACNSCAYPSDPPSSRPTPPNVRFASTQAAAYSAAANIFVANTFTRCNADAVTSSAAATADLGGDVLFAYSGICATRMACIAAGNPPAPALPVDHPGESPTCAVPIMSLVVTEYTLIRSSSLCMYSWASFAFKHCQVGAGLNQCRRSVLKLIIYIIVSP